MVSSDVPEAAKLEAYMNALLRLPNNNWDLYATQHEGSAAARPINRPRSSLTNEFLFSVGDLGQRRADGYFRGDEAKRHPSHPLCFRNDQETAAFIGERCGTLAGQRMCAYK